MALVKCKLCGTLYNQSSTNGHRICRNCMRRLEELYGHVHEYMRDNDEENFDIYTLADAMDISTADVQALVDLGYIERDLQTYSKNKKGNRQQLAEKLNNELDKMRKESVTTYGGVVYAREKRNEDDSRQYVYDSQRASRRK